MIPHMPDIRTDMSRTELVDVFTTYINELYDFSEPMTVPLCGMVFGEEELNFLVLDLPSPWMRENAIRSTITRTPGAHTFVFVSEAWSKNITEEHLARLRQELPKERWPRVANVPELEDKHWYVLENVSIERGEELKLQTVILVGVSRKDGDRLLASQHLDTQTRERIGESVISGNWEQGVRLEGGMFPDFAHSR